MSYWMPPSSKHLYPPYKIAALVKLLAESGVPAAVALHGTRLNSGVLDDASSLTSIEQYLLVCRNALRLLQDRSLPFRLGEKTTDWPGTVCCSSRVSRSATTFATP